jgi:hypothetical protein
VEQDDPGLRLEWEKKAWGTANPEFRRHALREANKHNQRLGRIRGGGAEAGASLGGGASTSRLAPNSLVSGPVWISLGPTGAESEQNGSFTGLVRDSGRARTILPHPTDPNILYFLTSGGGLWKTTNFESGSTTWKSLTDNLPTTGGGAVAFGRTGDVLYLGLGDPYDQILVGGAMVKSSDGGDSWSPMIELGSAVSVRAVAVDTSGPDDVIMVATEIGMFRSTDSGASYSPVATFTGNALWSIISTSAGWLASAQPCSSIGEQCTGITTLYLSTDAGATWNPISNAGNVFNTNGRTTLAVGLPGDAIVYAYSSTSPNDTAMRDVYRSSDGGQTWVANNVNSTKIPTNPVTGASTMPNMNICHAQCWYNQMILVDPTDATRNTVYIGGDLGSARTTDGGTTWTITSWWLYNQVATLPYVHADFHAAAFKSTGTPAILFGSDGGLFMSTDSGATFTSDKNNGLVTHLFYTIAGTPSLPNFAIGGLQDNGTRARVGNSSIFNQVVGGDGLGANFSQANANTSFGSSQSSGLRANLSGRAPDVFQNAVTATTGIVAGEAGFFTDIYAPAGNLDPTGRIFFTFTATRVYKTINGGLNWTVIARVNTAPTVGLPAGRTFRSTAYNLGVSPLDLNRIVMGAAGGFIDISTDGGVNWVDVNMISLVPGYAGFVSNVTWADNKTIWIAAAAQAAGTKRVVQGTIANEGDSWTTATWVVKDSGLPDLPVTKLILDPRDGTKNTLYAATHVGVYRTTDGGASWQPYGANLPNVRVTDMYMPPDGGYLRIATYGRGVWEIPQLEFVNAAITDDVVSCDHNGALGEGETGHLTITLHNQGSNTLSNITAIVTSSNPHVSFPSGNSVVFPPADGSSDTVASLTVALNGASGVETTDFTISFTDSGLNVTSPLSVVSTQLLNYDEVPSGTATETFESSTNLWTTDGTSPVFPNIQGWQRVEIAPLQHVWNGPDNNGQTSGSGAVSTDNSLISPSMHVGSDPLSVSFSHRFSFQGSVDGGVVEISTDGGASWTDIGTGAYNGTLVASSNPLGVRGAFVNRSAGWPNFITATLNLGTTFAGQDIKIRFRVGADNAVGAPGWDIDNITITGLTTNPFVAVNPHNTVCGTSGQLASSPNPSVFGQQVTLTANVSGGVSTATGNVDFKEGDNVLGSSGLDGNGQAQFSTSTLNAGPHSITANYGGDGTHAVNASNTLVQTVSQATPTITVSCPSDVTFDGNPHSCTASATGVGDAAVTGSLALTYNGGAAPSNAGTYSVSASFSSGDANYTDASGSGSLIIAKAGQSITFGGLAGKTFGDPDFSVSATGGGSGNDVTFAASGNCTVAGSTVHITGGGSCTITASQAGNDNYSAAPDVPQTFTIAKANQTIIFGALTGKTFGDPDFSVSATASSTLAVSFAASGNCTVVGSTVQLTGAGSCTITAQQGGDGNYNAASDVPQSFTIAKANQTITFAALADKTFLNADFSVSATASSTLAVAFGASGNCSVSGSTVHITGAGSCTITAAQAGNGNFNPAADVPRSFNIAMADQTITFGALPDKTFGDPDFTVSGTSTSGLSVGFRMTGNCSGTGSTVHILTAGSCSVTATQVGDANFNPAPEVIQSFNIAKASQTITFAALPNKLVGDPDFTVSATASSGLAVSFVAGGSCTMSGSTVHLTGAGTCTITASQAGDLNRNPAPNVARPFTVANPDFTLALTLPSVTVAAGQSVTDHITFTPNPGTNAPISFNCSGLPALSTCTFTPATVPAGNSPVDVALTIATTGPSAALQQSRATYATWVPFGLGFGLIGIVVIGTRGRRRKITTTLVTLAFVVMLLVGCGGHSTPNPGNPGTPKGTFPITVTATSGSVTHSSTFNLTVN